MFLRFGLAMLASLPFICTQAFADDDFVISHEQNHRVIMGGTPEPAAILDLDGDKPAAAPKTDVSLTGTSAGTRATPQVPAGWDSLTDNTANGGGVLAGGAMDGAAGANNAGFGRATGLPTGNFSTGAAAPAIGTTLQQALQPVLTTHVNRYNTPASSGYVSLQQGSNRLPLSAMVNNLAAAGAAEEGDESAAPSQRERVMMASFLNTLLQYVMSQPDYDASSVFPHNGAVAATHYSSGARIATRNVLAGPAQASPALPARTAAPALR